jgi:hypothetical protein
MNRSATPTWIALGVAALPWAVAIVFLGALSFFHARVPAKAVAVPSGSASLWDTGTQAFTPAPPLVVGRTHAAGARLSDGSVLIAGGESRTTDGFDRVPSFASDVWRLGRPASPGGALTEQAADAIELALSGGRAMLMSGGVAPEIARSDGSSWERGHPYPEPLGMRGTFASALLPNGSVLLVLPGRAKAYAWDAVSDVWTEVAHPTLGVTEPQLLALADGRLLLVGAFSSATRFQTWTPGASSWESKSEWRENAVCHRLVQLTGGEVLVVREVLNGWEGTLRDAALWDPATGELTSMAAPTSSVVGSTLTALADGLALHAGDPAPELWTSSDRTWLKLPVPTSPVQNHVAVRLDETHVLLAGGDGPIESHREATHVWIAALAGLAALVLLIGGFAVARAARFPVAMLAAALLLAGLVATLLSVYASIPRGGG